LNFFFLEARIFSSTVSQQMQEATAEGMDDEDITSIIVSELIQRFGGNW
jgi:hypothetical protein